MFDREKYGLPEKYLKAEELVFEGMVICFKNQKKLIVSNDVVEIINEAIKRGEKIITFIDCEKIMSLINIEEIIYIVKNKTFPSP